MAAAPDENPPLNVEAANAAVVNEENDIDVVRNILSIPKARKCLLTCFGFIGHQLWQELGSSPDAIAAADPEVLAAAVERIRRDGWARFLEVVGEADYKIIPGVDLPETISSAQLDIIANNLYAKKPESGSYKYVGDQWECRVILMQELHGGIDDGNKDPEAENAIRQAVAAAAGRSWSWNSASGRAVTAPTLRRCHRQGDSVAALSQPPTPSIPLLPVQN